MASANLSITGIKGYNAGWSGWYSVGGGQDVYAGGESGSNIFTTAIRFTVPATTGISSGRSLTFSLWFLKGYYSSTNLTYALTASAPKDGQRTPNGTVIKSGTLSLTNLTPGYKNFSLTLSNLSLPVSGGTYYLYLYNGYWCSFGNQSSYKASGYLSYTPHTKTTGWSISTSSLALGSPLTISLPAATEGNGSNKHWIVYKTSTGQEGTISWPTGFSTSVTWTPSLSLASGIPSATSMTCTIQCDTYASDDTFIGSDTRSVTLTVPNSMVPSCTFSTLTLNDGGKNNLLVKGISTLTASITGISGSYGSSVNSYKFSIESTDGTVHWSTTGNVSGGTLSLTSPTLNIAISGASATKRVRVVLTDSRGRTCTVTKDCTYYNYASPIITGFEAYRVGSSGSTTKDMSGDYLYVYLKTNNITSLGGTNKRTSVLSYSPTLSGTTANPSDAWGSNGYKAWFNVSAVQQTLTITYVYSDDYFTTRSTLYVQAASIPLDIAFNGTGIGLGTHAESPNLFDIGFSANIRGNLKVDGTISSSDQYRIKWQTIPDGADLNDDAYRMPGYYRSTSGQNNILNAPKWVQGAFEMVVTGIADGTYCTQTVKDYRSDYTYVRTQINWTTPWIWSDWTWYPLSADLNGYAKLQSPNNLIHNGNEVTFVPAGFNTRFWFNYRCADGSGAAKVTEYRFGDGTATGSLAPIKASGIYADTLGWKTLWSGKLTSGSITITGAKKYAAILVSGHPGSEAYRTHICLPTGGIDGQMVTNMVYMYFGTTYSGDDCTITLKSNPSNGDIDYVWGIVQWKG